MRVFRRDFIFNFLAASILSIGITGCGGDSSNGGSGSDESASGDPQNSSFDVAVESNDGQTEDISGEQPNEQTSENSWGAVIAQDILQMTFTSNDGRSLVAHVKTSESSPAPGVFTTTQPPEGTFVTLTLVTAGEVYDSGSNGSIKLDSCPTAVGDKVVGSFQDIELTNVQGTRTRTLSGDFDVAVYAKNGDLFCEKDTDKEEPTDGGVCEEADDCGEGGVCCPYAQCIAQCQLNCLTQDSGCNFGANPSACYDCEEGCLDQCDVSAECRTEYLALSSCSEQNSCIEAEGENGTEQCLKGNCCDQYKAAF